MTAQGTPDIPPARRRLPRRPALDRDTVLRAALAVVDEHGVDAVTMRRVAMELGVDPMALYRYVGNKEGLLEGIVEQLWMAIHVPRADPSGWVGALRAFAHDLRRVLQEHPNATSLMLSLSAFPRPALEIYRELLKIMKDAGMEERRGAAIVRSVTSITMSDAVTGATYQAFTDRNGAAEDGPSADTLISLAQLLPSDTPPELVHVAYAICAPLEAQSDFELVIELILRGIEDES